MIPTSFPPTRIPRLPLGSRWSRREPLSLLNGISSSFPQTRIPRLPLGSWWSRQEDKLTGSPLRFPHLQNSTSPTQAAPCKGKGTSPDEYEPGLNLTAYGIQALNLSIDLCSVLSGLLCPLPTYNFTDPSQYSIPAIPALAWSVPNIKAVFTIQLVDSNSRLPAACLQITLTNVLTATRAVTWLSASFLILAALIALAAVTIAPSSFLLTAPPCEPCGKSFNTLVAQNNHLVIKKHHQTINQQPKENKHQQTKIGHLAESSSNPIAQLDSLDLSEKIEVDAIPSEQKKADLERLIELQIAQAPRIEPNECLFCPRSSSVRFADPDQALTHMLRPHGFFLPDQEYLVNRPSLLAYLAETIAVWNVCLYCGTGFGGKITADQALPDHASLTRKGLESVRKHMCDKNHCKLAWDTEEQRLEYSDFFDYRASYKKLKPIKNKAKANRISSMVEEAEWEDMTSKSSDVSDNKDNDSLLEERQAALGDSAFEPVLPNGVRLGHWSLRYIYKQNLLPYAVGSQSTQAGNRNINLITRLAVLSSPAGTPSALTDHTEASSVLIPRLVVCLISSPSTSRAINDLRDRTGGKGFSTTQDTVAFISQLYLPFNQQHGTVDFPYYQNSS
ncbi:hypothetical protein PTTG_29014 [Puccinia triticina 1-1 BBBD Race 1]|uniref:C2H2-type domain-containing protein n=1 Tax=Puccinia triticina (isolate 1-1 / race 1 (BBBD)) TaxID=630390 RepID=A0A180G7F0_PUCT1|nr:hypothetical protein PTTG_29014 [Puccinia triticina 1-1 BBBD Race 1]